MTDSLSSELSVHGLFENYPPPSREILQQWLVEKDVFVADGLNVCEMIVEDSESTVIGWRVVANREIDVGELICSIPKSALLSSRSSSLPPLFPLGETSRQHTTSYTILHLALCLLHELRLGTGSPFYGYLQALPRESRAIGLPSAWGIEEVAGEDGRKGLAWLEGSEAEMDMLRKDKEGLGLEGIRRFYLATGSHLPPTPAHPSPSPFLAFLHAYCLVSTRAFLVDLYHIVALCPFADLFNHSSLTPHTSLASDDFVCHLCGSLRTCQHDIPNTEGIARRLAHLGDAERRRVEHENDTVEMRVERRIEAGDEVWNCYGDGVGDARLLVEWGFISEEFAGEGLTWDMEGLWDRLKLEHDLSRDTGGVLPPSQLRELLRAVSEQVLQINNDEESLLCLSTWKDPETLLLNLDQSARISIPLFTLISLSYTKSSIDLSSNIEGVTNRIIRSVEEVEEVWRRIRDRDDDDQGPSSSGETSTQDGGVNSDTSAEPSPETIKTANRIRQLLLERLSTIHRPGLTMDALFDIRDKLRPDETFQRMALTLTINERQLLVSGMEKWHEWLKTTGRHD